MLPKINEWIECHAQFLRDSMLVTILVLLVMLGLLLAALEPIAALGVFGTRVLLGEMRVVGPDSPLRWQKQPVELA